jgi:excisionase family DNA binding protein
MPGDVIINPFELILDRFDQLETRLLESGKITPPEIIDRAELCKRLDITEPTVIRWEKKGKIPCFRIGSACRYNWTTVVKALEK